MEMEQKDLYAFYAKNARSGMASVVRCFTAYEEAEKYWEETFARGLHKHVWGVHFHLVANKESDEVDITKEVIFGKAQVELR